VPQLRPLRILYYPHPALSQREREQSWGGFTIPSPSGRGTQGEGIRATTPLIPGVLTQFQMPVLPSKAHSTSITKPRVSGLVITDESMLPVQFSPCLGPLPLL
jgi:hypothetical protein